MLNHDTCQAQLREEELTVDVHAHLATCELCRAYQAKLAALDVLLLSDRGEDVTPSAAFEARVLASVKAPPFWKTVLRPWLLAPVTAAALAFAVFTSLPHTPATEDEELVADAEMLADLDLLHNLDAAEDFSVIASLQTLEQ